jgi:hypothetical protein
MSLPIRLLPEARTEFDAAADWYESQRTGLGGAFVRRIHEVLDRIAANPLLHATVYKDVRKAVVKQFPFVVLYKEDAGRFLSFPYSTAREIQQFGNCASEAAPFLSAPMQHPAYTFSFPKFA